MEALGGGSRERAREIGRLVQVMEWMPALDMEAGMKGKVQQQVLNKSVEQGLSLRGS